MFGSFALPYSLSYIHAHTHLVGCFLCVGGGHLFVVHLRRAATDGVVIATEKRLPSLLCEPESFEKISALTDSTGVVYSGMGPDFRVLVRKARKAAFQRGFIPKRDEHKPNASKKLELYWQERNRATLEKHKAAVKKARTPLLTCAPPRVPAV